MKRELPLVVSLCGSTSFVIYVILLQGETQFLLAAIATLFVVSASCWIGLHLLDLCTTLSFDRDRSKWRPRFARAASIPQLWILIVIGGFGKMPFLIGLSVVAACLTFGTFIASFFTR